MARNSDSFSLRRNDVRAAPSLEIDTIFLLVGYDDNYEAKEWKRVENIAANLKRTKRQ